MRQRRASIVLAPLLALGSLLAIPTQSEAGSPQLTCAGVVARSNGPDIPITAPEDPTRQGTPGDDTLVGTEGADVIIGGGGNDTIYGLGGQDQICGGDDTTPNSGNDTIYGGGAIDVILPDDGSDNIFGGGGGEHPAVDDSTSDEIIYFDADTPQGMHFNTELGTASDKAAGAPEGSDTFTGIEIIVGTSYDDTMIGSELKDDYFAGYAGDDHMEGKGGTDSISFQLAPDGVSVRVFLEGGTAYGFGEDTFSDMEYVFGTEGSDYLVGNDDVNVILGDDGDDWIFGRGGNDPLVGGAGDDQIYGGVGELDWDVHEERPSLPVDVNLTQGNSVIGGTRAACLGVSPPPSCEVDKLFGIELAGGSSANDILTGNNGANYFFADPGNDTIDGKGGHDVAAYFRATSGINADLGASGINITGLGNDRVRNVEGMTGTIYNDVLRGSAADNFLNALEGNDKVFSEGGRDYILTGPGKDRIDGGSGKSDLLDFSSALQKVEADLQTGKATGEGNDTLKNLEELSGSANGDVLKGNAAPNKLLGGLGKDKLFGRAGNDALSGQEGTDQLNGEAGKDSCNAKSESKNCETYKIPKDHPLFEVSRRYKRLEDLDRRYKRRYK